VSRKAARRLTLIPAAMMTMGNRSVAGDIGHHITHQAK
jgi:hypothetical protein